MLATEGAPLLERATSKRHLNEESTVEDFSVEENRREQWLQCLFEEMQLGSGSPTPNSLLTFTVCSESQYSGTPPAVAPTCCSEDSRCYSPEAY